MPITLVEANKLALGRNQTMLSAIIELFATTSPILKILPFRDIEGNALSYNLQETLPGIGFRGVNAAFAESTGVINPKTEQLVIAGGDMDVDSFIINTQGSGIRETHETMKVTAAALRWTKEFIKGDNTTDPTVFSGLQARVSGDQVISAGSDSGGSALSLNSLDRLIDQVSGPTHLVMNKTLRRRLTAASRDPAVGGDIHRTVDQFGVQVTSYAGLPILEMERDNEDNEILGFDEAAFTGTPTATSIYCLSVGTNKLSGIQNGGIRVRDLGELQSKPVMRTRVEWYTGMTIYNGRSVARLNHIADAPVVK